jgi:hypothetical protein
MSGGGTVSKRENNLFEMPMLRSLKQMRKDKESSNLNKNRL